jgi:hypothetical protein
MTYQRNWSMLTLGGMLVALFSLVLGVMSMPAAALADGGGSGGFPIDGDTDTTGGCAPVGESTTNPDTDSSLTTWDLLLYSLIAVL